MHVPKKVLKKKRLKLKVKYFVYLIDKLNYFFVRSVERSISNWLLHAQISKPLTLKAKILTPFVFFLG